MPLLFAYGTLQQESVQLSIVGRRLDGEKDELVECELSSVRIDDPALIAAIGTTRHVNVTFNGNKTSRVPGMVFEVTEADITRIDEYEAQASYERVAATLASGRLSWVYVHADTEPESS
jgi:gamma-glutamylcyclotransferase (GGCT)/AIG2-like uncharacterized protein YtfP